MIVPTPVSPDAKATELVPSQHLALLPPGVLHSFILVTGLFFLWGIPSNLNDVLIRQFMKSFEISRFQGGLVQSAFYMGYFLLALPAGISMKHGLLPGLILFAVGCFLFLPAAKSGKYGFFLASLFIVASGLAFLETASNPFIAQLGPTATSEPRLNLAQAFNPLGAIAGALAGTLFIFSGVEHTKAQAASMRGTGTYNAYLHSELLRVVIPYLALVWAVMIALTRFPAFVRQREAAAERSAYWHDLLHQRHFIFAVVAQFMYVGAQVGTWSYFIQYANEYGHTTERGAGILLTCTLGAFGIGRFSSAVLMRRIAPSLIMTVYALLNIGLLLIGIFDPGKVGLGSILVTSFFMSMMFPTIFAMGLKDLGPNSNIAASVLVMSVVGGAILPPLMGLFHTTATSYQIPLYGYIAVAAYARFMRSYTSDRILSSTYEV